MKDAIQMTPEAPRAKNVNSEAVLDWIVSVKQRLLSPEETSREKDFPAAPLFYGHVHRNDERLLGIQINQRIGGFDGIKMGLYHHRKP